MQHIILTRNQYFRNRNAWGFLILNLKSGMYFTVTALAMFPVLHRPHWTAQIYTTATLKITAGKRLWTATRH